MIYGYIRVSTEKQTVKNQQLAIQQYCKARRLRNVVWVAETISGTKKIEKRQLGNLIKSVTSNDMIIVTELSCFGRSLRMILDVLEDLLERHVTVVAIKEGFELGDNMQSRVLAFAFGLCAEVERTLLSERTKQGLVRARKEGKQIGRQKGQKSCKYKLSGKASYIRREREKGRSKRSLAQELHVTRTTIHNFMKLKKIQ